MKVFAYIRVSSEEQAVHGNSLFEQEERLIKFSKNTFHVDPELFIDDGVSAKDLNRKKLTLMLERIKLGGPGVVITSKLDRLSRSLRDTLNLIDFFDSYNFKFMTESERFDTTTSEGMMVLQQLGSFAQFERARNSERVSVNLQSIVRNSKKAVSRPCFGYDIVDRFYTPNPEEVLVLQQMFEWALNGDGPLKIAQKLNALGIRTKSKSLWSDRTVRMLMRRDTLIGHFTYNKTHRKGSRVYTRPAEEWINNPEHHTPIIDEDIFFRVGEIFDSRKKIGRRVSEDRYLLSGLIRCGHCGSRMAGKSSGSEKKSGLTFRYLCTGYMRKRICFSHSVSRDELETLVKDRIQKVAYDDLSVLELDIAQGPGADVDVDLIKKQIEKLDKQIQKQIEAYSEDLITASDLKVATNIVEAKRAELRIMLDSAAQSGMESQQKNLKSRATELVQDVVSEDRLKSKQSIYQLIEKIEILNGSEINIIWRGY